MAEERLKQAVRAYWEEEPCGTRYGVSGERARYFEEIRAARDAMEPYIAGFAGFAGASGLKVLEVGVGAGSDYTRWLQGGADAVGLDLTLAGARLTREHAEVRGMGGKARVVVADAENLPLASGTFDVAYSWGVVHHSPDTPRALGELRRVLRPGGSLRVMVYHVHSWTAWLLWVRYGLMRGRVGATLQEVLAAHLESPGTKAYGVEEFRDLLASVGLGDVEVRTHLSTSDLLLQAPSTRYRGWIYRVIWALYPRWAIKLLGHRFGMVLMAEATVPGAA